MSHSPRAGARLTPVEVEVVMPPYRFDELAGELAAVGFEAHKGQPLEERSVDPDAVAEFLLRVWDWIDEEAAGALVAAVVLWVRKRRKGNQRVTVKLLGPDGKVVRKVDVDE